MHKEYIVNAMKKEKKIMNTPYGISRVKSRLKSKKKLP